MRPTRGFTLIELLTVMFLIGLLVAIIAPAITKVVAEGPIVKTKRYIEIISMGVEGYKDRFGQYPPSEPDMVDSGQDFVTDLANGFYGPGALRLYLIGHDRGGQSSGYHIDDDQKGWHNPGSQNEAKEARWEPLVKGVPIDGKEYSGISATYSTGVKGAFMDAWGNAFDYFKAHAAYGSEPTAAAIYPRAVNTNPDGSSPYSYISSHDVRVGGYSIRVPVHRWLSGKAGWDADYRDYKKGWANYATPIHANAYLIVSPGADGQYGDTTDLGNW